MFWFLDRSAYSVNISVGVSVDFRSVMAAAAAEVRSVVRGGKV